MRLGIVASGKEADLANGAVRMSASNHRYTRSSSGFNNSSDTTVCAWAKLAVDRNDYSGILSASNGSQYAQLGANSTGTRLGLSASTGGIASDPAFDFTVGVWVFLAVVRKVSDNDELYYDEAPIGSIVQSIGSFSGLTDTNTLYVGDDGFGGWWNGSIAAVKMWTAALTQAELETERGFYAAQRTSGLWAAYSFRSGPQTTDDSGNGRSLTAGAGTPALDSAGPPIT